MLDTGQLALTPEALVIFRYGLAAAAAGNLERAIALYDQVLDIQADCYEVWHERGLVLERQGNYAGAIASYDRALSLYPPEDAICEIWFERGNALQYGLGDCAQAISCYDRALKLKGRHDTVLQNRGNALLYGMSLPEEALHSYDRALAINPDNHLAWRNRGNALVELQRYGDAIASYDQALDVRPDDQIAWHARLLAAEKLGLAEQQPTTDPAWYGSGFSKDPAAIAERSKVTAADADASRPRQPVLIVEDDWGRREVLLERDSYRIGRDPNADICLHSQFVSRQHATLVRKTLPDGHFTYRVIDGIPNGKPSTNGLLVNRKKCSSADLGAEDLIVLGPKVQLTYRLLPMSDRLFGDRE